MNPLRGAVALASVLLCPCAYSQAIEFQNNGFSYQTLSRSGVTVMFTHLPGNLHEYVTIQVAVSNGSQGPYVIRPEDFTFERADGQKIHAVSAHTVIEMLLKKATGRDAIKLVIEYENGIYGNLRLASTSGYESRREAAIASTGTKVKTAALASALALVQTKLAPGDSIDGAVFFPTDGKPLGTGRLVVRTNTDTFEFNAE
jgi:hypothetical protein